MKKRGFLLNFNQNLDFFSFFITELSLQLLKRKAFATTELWIQPRGNLNHFCITEKSAKKRPLELCAEGALTVSKSRLIKST